jgi:transposase
MRTMSERFVVVDRVTPMLLPPSLQDWLPEGHLAHFVVETVGLLPLHGFQVNTRGTGNAQFPPSMMLSLLIYNYAIGRMSSRQIEKATYEDVASRYICGGDAHPDHDTICTFRRQNAGLFKECFVKVLEYAREMGVLAKRGGVSVDGTKIGANASKHAAVSHGRAVEMIAELEGEVQTLMELAEQADREARPEPLKVPEELARRENRLAKLKKAQAVIEERHAARTAEKQRDYEAKMAERAARRARGEGVGGSDPQPPSATPDAKEQYNFTDPESRIMKAGNGAHFEQSYNAQAAVDTEGSLLVLGAYVTDAANDKQQLVPAVQSVVAEVRETTEVLADSGYFSEAAVAAVEGDNGPTVYAAVEKTGHHRTVADLLASPEPETPASGAIDREAMRRRLRTATGRAAYKKRKETVEPVFGIIKAVMGFRRFLLRGKRKVSLEWSLVTLAYNFRRIARLLSVAATPSVDGLAAQTA